MWIKVLFIVSFAELNVPIHQSDAQQICTSVFPTTEAVLLDIKHIKDQYAVEFVCKVTKPLR